MIFVFLACVLVFGLLTDFFFRPLGPSPDARLKCADEGHDWNDAVPGLCTRCHDKVRYAGPVKTGPTSPYR